MAELHEIPSPPGQFLLGNLSDLMSDRTPTELLLELHKYGPLFQLKYPFGRSIIASGYEIVNELCDEKRFDKAIKMELEVARDMVGDGLLTAHTQEPNWQKAHQILTPSFSARSMKEYLPLMQEVAGQLVERWEKAALAGTLVDVGADMTRLSFETIGRCGFSQSFDCFSQEETHPFLVSLTRCFGRLSERSMTPNLVNMLMLSRQREWEHDIQSMNSVVDSSIQARKETIGQEHRDMLQVMLTCPDKASGTTLSDLNIRNQALTFLIAGHETTSGLLSFTMYLLVKHPAILARVQQEIDAVLTDDAPPTHEQLGQLPYLMQVLKESLRLWPPAPGFLVYPYEDTVVGGRYALKKGEMVAISTPCLHRDKSIWGENAEEFDPDRFTHEREAALPANAYKPFGNGQRACIGRQFAMIEAQLAVAMVLKRFQPIDHANYQLHLKDMLTIKPKDFTLKLKARSAGGQTHATPLLVLYGSNMGTCEEMAAHVAQGGSSAGYQVTRACLDDYADARLPTEGVVLVVTSSYNGTPPDNARKFCEGLDKAPAGALQGVRYAIFGCGNHEWAATYQKVPRSLDARFEELGAVRLAPAGEADVATDYDADFRRWYDQLWPKLASALGLAAGNAPAARSYDSFSVEILEEQHPNPFAATFGALPMTVIDNHEIIPGVERSVHHLELALPEGVNYQAGDHLGVLCPNLPDLVARAAARFGLSPQSRVRLKSRISTPLPTDADVSVSTLLTNHLELQEVATRNQLEVLVRNSRCPATARELRKLIDDDATFRSYVLEANRSLLDVLIEYPACELGFGVFLELLNALKPRYYSISSSPRQGRVLSLTVGVVKGPARKGFGQYAGTCSNYLASRVKGQTVHAFVHDTHATFRLPPSPRTPVIMVGPGTGLAPFRGFLQEREGFKAEGLPLGPALLFFGCRHPEQDFLYREELEGFARAGISDLFTAFSRQDPTRKAYVQDRIQEEEARVWELLEQGAYVYICGDGSRMAPDVRRALAGIISRKSGKDGEAAVEVMMAEGRYLLDVWASNAPTAAAVMV